MSTEESQTSDDEDTYKAISPCQRWCRRNIRLSDVPGIDALYQALDMEEGVEVVWNEMNIPCVPLDDEGLFKLTDKLAKLTKIEHPNILKLYGSWYNKETSTMIFITEYYSAGSLTKFIQRNHKINKSVSLTVWKRWSRQVLSALSYLHSKSVGITHGYLTTDTVFIQHDGFVKLGSVAPSTIQDHIATCSRTHRQRHKHYCAPEFVQKMVHKRSSSVDGKKSSSNDLTKTIQRPFSVDIYAFGIFCLEVLYGVELHKEKTDVYTISLDEVQRSIKTLEPINQDLINLCIQTDVSKRPTAPYLLTLNVFYEIPSLKVMCVNMLLHAEDVNLREVEDVAGKEQYIAVNNGTFTMVNPPHLDISKIDREIKNGMHSIANLGAIGKISPIRKSYSPDTNKEVPNEETEVMDLTHNKEAETRLILCIRCQLNPSKVSGSLHLELEFQMNDNMVRVLSTDIKESEDPMDIVNEIIDHGLLNSLDREMVLESLVECLQT